MGTAGYVTNIRAHDVRKRAPQTANATTIKRQLRFPETAVALAGVKSAIG